MNPDPTISLDTVKLVLFANGSAVRQCHETQQSPTDFDEDEWSKIVHDLATGKEQLNPESEDELEEDEE